MASEMIGRLLDFLLPDRNPCAASAWCRIGLHRWEPLVVGGCEECGMHDRILDP